MLGALAVFAQLAIAASAPDTVALDGMADVRVTITSDATAVPSIITPAFRPFLLVRSATSVHVSMRTGTLRRLAEYRYTLAPTREGTFVIPGFVARVGLEVARSPVLRIVVRAPAASARMPAILNRAHVSGGTAVSFRSIVVPETVYVGQQATYQLGVFLDPAVRDRVRRMEAIAPDMPGVMTYEPSGAMEVYDARAADGQRLDAHIYQRAIFPLAAGRIAIPPARLTYALPLSYSFFSREESYEMRSDSVVLVALDPPVALRPAGYGGAVGRLRLDASLDTGAARVGDPLTLRVRVTGEGNVRLWPRPAVAVSWATNVPSGEQVTLDPGEATVQGTKEFEWLLTPQRAGIAVLPPITYPYWDPSTGQYRTAETVPETLTVAPGALAASEADSARRPRRLALRTVYRGPLPIPLHHERGFWLTLCMLPLPAVLLAARHAPPRSARATRRRRSAEVHLRHLARAAPSPGAGEIRRALVAALVQRLALASDVPWSRAALTHAVRRGGATPESVHHLDVILAALDEAAYGRSTVAGDVAARAYALYCDLDGQMRRPSTRRTRVVVLVLLLPTTTISLRGFAAADAPARDFMHGVGSYERGEYTLSVREFTRAAASDPRAPDAWANLGTAAWAAGDTANAAFGWQRALRLEPLAKDLRDRIALAGAGEGLGRVLPIQPLALALAAASLWFVAWSHAAYRAAHRRSIAVLSVAAPLLVAVLLAIAAWDQDGRLAARDLAIIARSQALRFSPTLTADPTGTVRIGEVTRVLARAGIWARVQPEPGRDGWVPAATLLPLAEAGARAIEVRPGAP